MAKLWGRRVVVTRVDKNTVKVTHTRQRGARRLRDAEYTTTDSQNRNIRRDHVHITRKQAKKQGLLGKLFGGGAREEDNKPKGGGLSIRW